MSLHQNHNVKERQKPTHRLTPFSRGDPCALFLVTSEAFQVVRPVGEVASMPTTQHGQHHFALLLHFPSKMAVFCGLQLFNTLRT